MTDTAHMHLGRFICVHPKKRGGHRVTMVVPARLRPEGWPSCIRLPEIGGKTGTLDDPKFKNRILKDVQRLNSCLDERRNLEMLRLAPDKSLPKLAEIYFNRDRYLQLSESRQYRNRRSVMKILEWSASRGHPDVPSLTALDVDDFLSNYARCSATRFDMRSVWNVLFAAAIYAGWVKDSPMPRGNWETPKPVQLRVWKQEDVDRYAAMARQMGQPGLAAMMITIMKIGQRMGDMRTAQWGREYFGDRFVIKQSKTGQLVNIPIPAPLREELASVRLNSSPYVFNDFDKRSGFTDSRLTQRFMEIRHALTVEGEQVLQLRGLRHACVCSLMEAGLHTAQIAGITGHRLARVHSILERYYPDRWGMAESGMRRAFAASGYDPEAFGEVRPMTALDWDGDPKRMARHVVPEYTEANVERLLAVQSGQHRLKHTVQDLKFSRQHKGRANRAA